MKNYIYYAVFFDDNTKKRLEESTDIPDGWKVFCDHCTLIHHTCDEQLIVPFLDMFIGKTVAFNVIGYGKSDYAMAYIVDIPSMNKVSHITIATAPNHPPVESNQITDWFYFPDPLFDSKLTGWLGVIGENSLYQ